MLPLVNECVSMCTGKHNELYVFHFALANYVNGTTSVYRYGKCNNSNGRVLNLKKTTNLMKVQSSYARLVA